MQHGHLTLRLVGHHAFILTPAQLTYDHTEHYAVGENNDGYRDNESINHWVVFQPATERQVICVIHLALTHSKQTISK